MLGLTFDQINKQIELSQSTHLYKQVKQISIDSVPFWYKIPDGAL